jgi:hypothetical protein
VRCMIGVYGWFFYTPLLQFISRICSDSLRAAQKRGQLANRVVPNKMDRLLILATHVQRLDR